MPVLGTRRRLTPEYRRDVASLVLDTGSTNRVCGDGGFAPLEALPRRVAGVSRLSWCNSPRLVASSTWGELDRAPLMVHFPPFASGVIGKQVAPGLARALWPFRSAALLWRWGFCTIRSLATACRASNAAISPVWWRPRRGVSSTARLSQCNFSRLLAVSSESRSRPGSPALSGPLGVRRYFGDGGFAPLEALPRRVAPLMLQFPPFGGGKVVVRGGVVAVRGGVAPKVQTTSAKNADNGVSWARWSAFWAKLSRTWCVVRTRTRYSVR